MAEFSFYWNMFWMYVGWWLVPLVVIFIYKKRLSAYPIDVVIYEKRGNALIKTNDVAGRFSEPVNCYKLKMSKDTIPIPQYDWVLQCMHRPTNLFEKIVNMLVGKIGSITVFKYSSKQYKPVQVKLNDNNFKWELREVRDSKGNPVYVNILSPINPNTSFSKLDFEVIDWDDINHMTQELRAIATRRSPIMKFLEKYGAMIAIVLAIIALIIAGYYYKEMLIDAGSRYQAMTTPSRPSTPEQEQQQIAQQPDIPLIGDLV